MRTYALYKRGERIKNTDGRMNGARAVPESDALASRSVLSPASLRPSVASPAALRRRMGLSVSPPPHPPRRRKLRFLCLHGFRTSGRILQSQLRKWDDSVHELLDLVFLDGPFNAAGKSDVEGYFDPPYYEWFQFGRNGDDVQYQNLDECVEFITNFMKTNGPFDGLLGFSQGAFLSAALTGMQQQGMLLPSLPPLRSVILISGGVLLGDHKWKDCYSDPISCPSLHFIGENDFLKPSNEKLLSMFKDPIAVRHGAKHTVPKLDKEAVLPLRTFLEDIVDGIDH